jgi:hypothetical protein
MSPLIREYAALVPFNPVEYVWIDFASGPLPTAEQSEEITRRLGQLPYTYDTPIEEWPLPFEKVCLLLPVTIQGDIKPSGVLVATLERADRHVLAFDIWGNISPNVPSIRLVAMYNLRGSLRVGVDPKFKKALGKTDDECQKYALNVFRTAWRKLVALSVLNIQAEAVASCTGNALVNAKRIRKGKRPFFEWTTVEVKPRAAVQEPKGGTHASPKPHMRRGHVRKLKSGKIVTIKPIIVNKHKMPDEGFVFHDYKVAALT